MLETDCVLSLVWLAGCSGSRNWDAPSRVPTVIGCAARLYVAPTVSRPAPTRSTRIGLSLPEACSTAQGLASLPVSSRTMSVKLAGLARAGALIEAALPLDDGSELIAVWVSSTVASGLSHAAATLDSATHAAIAKLTISLPKRPPRRAWRRLPASSRAKTATSAAVSRSALALALNGSRADVSQGPRARRELTRSATARTLVPSNATGS